jgi:hypothetical protein
MGPRKSKCDVHSGTTQGWACLDIKVVELIKVNASYSGLLSES